MSTPRILTNAKETLTRVRVPNSTDFVRTMDLGRARLTKLNYSISPDLTLIYNGSISDLFRSEEDLEKERKEAYLLLEKINVCHLKNGYDGKKVNDDNDNGIDDEEDPAAINNPNNIKIYDKNINEHLFNEKLTYYKYLTNEKKYKYPEGIIGYDGQVPKPLTGDFNLEDYVKYRGFVVIAQEFYGCGATCIELSPRTPIDVRGEFGTDPKYDVYDDRITKIWFKKEANTGRIIIEEYYRANVDSSIKYKNMGTKKLYTSIGAGVFDFIPGLFSYSGKYQQKKAIVNGVQTYIPDDTKREPALYTFDFNKNINSVQLKKPQKAKYKNTEELRKYLKNCYINNKFEDYTDITGNEELRMKFPAEGGGTKQLILIHRGLKNFTASEGCLSIFNKGEYLSDENGKLQGDYIDFMKTFLNDSANPDPMKREPKSEVGLLFLFKDKLL